MTAEEWKITPYFILASRYCGLPAGYCITEKNTLWSFTLTKWKASLKRGAWIKPGTRNIPEHDATCRNIPENPGTDPGTLKNKKKKFHEKKKYDFCKN